MTTLRRGAHAAWRGALAAWRAATVLGVAALLAGCSAALSGTPRIAAATAAATGAGTAAAPITTSAPAGPQITTPASNPPSSRSAAASSSPQPQRRSGSTAPPTLADTPLPPGEIAGAAGAGDPYYPTAGNGGYQVDRYVVVLTYDPAANQLDATATIQGTVTATQRLGRFNLDLQPEMRVSAVTVDQATAAFEQRGAELIITPAVAVAPSSEITVVVTYSGKPGMITSSASGLGDGGWYRTQDGGAVAAGEPFSASAWYPVNEHPADPAAFSVTATVPNGWEVISNGARFGGALPTAPSGMHSVRYDENRPIASYLTTLLIDKLTFTTATFQGRPIVNAFTPAAAGEQQLAGRTANVLRVLSNHFGPFPFDTYGGIYTGENLPFALETATRPVYASWVDLDTVIHETAHQWFGDDVMIKRWSDICINECIASYAPWLYHEDVDGANLDATWKQQMSQVAGDPSFWSIPLVAMGAGNEFTSVYDRGPLAMHALRHEMGEKPFADMLKGWIAGYGGKNAGFDDLAAYAAKLSGKDLTGFVDAWFRGSVVPPEPYRTPPGLA